MQPPSFKIDPSRWETWVIPAMGLVSAGAILLLGRHLLGGRGSLKATSPEAEPAPDPFHIAKARERRQVPRRGGNPVGVFISDSEGAAPPVGGTILNRSQGGLRIQVEHPLATEGTVLSIKARSATRSTPWTRVEVRTCRQTGTTWELGCQFVQIPNWGVLLLFG